MQKNCASKENRQHQRITPKLKAPIIIDIKGSNFSDILRIENISIGGARVSVAHEFNDCDIDKQINIAIKLPEPVNKSFSATGKIKHISGKAFGINFLSIHQHGEQVLRKYILFHQKNKSTWKSIRYFCHLY